MKLHLTKTTVAGLALPEGKSEVTFFDTKLPGFGLRIRAGGKRSWIALYRRDGRLAKLTLANADVLAPDAAREMARRELAKAIVSEVDPRQEKKKRRRLTSETLGGLIDGYLKALQEKVERGERRQRYVAEIDRHLRIHCKPLHCVSYHLITPGEISGRLKRIRDEVGAVTANRVRSSLSSMFAWAMSDDGLATHNPVRLTTPPLEEEASRERVLTDGEIAEIWQQSGPGDYGAIVRLLLLFGARRDEVGGMCWSEIDSQAGVWTIPAPRAKNKVACALPASRLALAELEAFARRDGRDLLFGARERAFSGWSKAKAELDQRIVDARKKAAEEAGTVARPLNPWRLHDLRRTMSTVMNEHLDILPHIADVCLNHVTGRKKGSSAVYNRADYMRQKREALTAWGEYVARIVTDVR